MVREQSDIQKDQTPGILPANKAAIIPQVSSPFSRLLLIVENPWFAYIGILLLQLKRVWGVWLYKDLTSGDTSAYFLNAYGWAHQFSVNVLWSPLYTAYYGTLLKILSNVYWATLLHRLIIVFALAILVLALMRRLLPAGLAWLIAAWWVLLPINFNSLYEIHLFAPILPLIACLLVLKRSGARSRGLALGILAIDMTLVRNEIVIAFSLWALACLWWELRQARQAGRLEIKKLLPAYALPLLLAALLFAFFNARTLIKQTPEQISRKHTLNVCQVYAFGYQQRNSDWNKSPWIDCQELMLRDFGKPMPSLLEAVQINPKAMFEHFLWNVRLTPAGIQLALFNASSASANPDYAPAELNNQLVLIPSLLCLALVLIASILLIRQRRVWWPTWFRDRAWGWLMLVCLSAVMMVVIPTQRPRPSYMFLFSLTLMALVGSALWVLARGVSVQRRVLQLASLLVVCAALLFTPSYFTNQPRPLLNFYNWTAPSAEYIGLPGTSLVARGYTSELCNYFTKASKGGCLGFTYDIFKTLAPGQTVAEFFAGQQPVPVVAFIADDVFFATYGTQPAIQAFLQQPEKEGWKLVSLQDNSNGRWYVYVNARYFNLPPSIR